MTEAFFYWIIFCLANEIDVEGRVGSKDRCEEAREECDLIRCPYGKEAFVDNQDCERCRCVDPCASTSCPEGTRCAIILDNSNDVTVYKGVCRSGNFLVKTIIKV